MTQPIRLLCLLVGMLASAGSFASGAPEKGSARSSPSAQQTMEAFRAAIKAGDVKKATALLLPDVEIYEEGGAQRSRSEYVEAHLLEDMAFMKTADVTVLRTKARIAGGIAWITTETRLRGTSDGQPFDVMTVETAILTRASRDWRIAHLHWSSRRAAEAGVASSP